MITDCLISTLCFKLKDENPLWLMIQRSLIFIKILGGLIPATIPKVATGKELTIVLSESKLYLLTFRNEDSSVMESEKSEAFVNPRNVLNRLSTIGEEIPDTKLTKMSTEITEQFKKISSRIQDSSDSD